MKKLSSLIVLLIILFFGNSVFAEEKLLGYKLIGVKNYEIYYWIGLNGDQNINYNGKSFSGFTDIPDEPLLTDTGKVIMIGEKNGELVVILDGNIIFTGKIEQLKIEKGNNETIFYINSKKYVVIKDLKGNLEKMTNEDFEKLESKGLINKENTNTKQPNEVQKNQTTNDEKTDTQINKKTKAQYFKQSILSKNKLKKAKNEKYIPVIEQLVKKQNKEKLEVLYKNIGKVKAKYSGKNKDILDYLEAIIYLELNK